MTVLLSPVGGVAAQFFDNNGNPLSGGKLFSYAAGTTTPAVTYTNSLGITAHTNPIVLDAGGRVPGGEIWLTDGIIYKFVLQTSTNVLIATYDNIVGINSNFVNYTTEQEIQTATAGQTVFNLTTTQYQPGTNSLTVYVDGVNQYGPGAQYAYLETDSDTVTFVSGLHVGASVKFTTATQVTGNATNASVVAFTGFNGQTGNVQDLADDEGSDWIGFLQDGTGAVAVSAQEKMRETISVKDFGAVGDGVTDDAPAIQAAIDYCQTVNQFGVSTVGYGRATLWFPSGVFLCKSPLIFYPFTNYVGVCSTTANTGSNFTDLFDSRGTIIRAHTSLYDPTAPVNSNARDGVLVQVPTGDCFIEQITFVGTAAINNNPSICIRFGDPAYTNTCQGLSLQNLRLVTGKIGFDCYASLIENGNRVYFESCTTGIVSNAAGAFGGISVGDEMYFTNSYIGAHSNGLLIKNNSILKAYLTNFIFRPNDTTGRDITGEYSAICTMDINLANCTFEVPFTGAAGAYSLDIRSFTDATHKTKVKAANCTFHSPVLIERDPGGGSSNFKYVQFSNCAFDCDSVFVVFVNGVRFVSCEFDETVLDLRTARRTMVIANNFERATNLPVITMLDACNLSKVIGNSVSDAVTSTYPTYSGTASTGITVIGNDQNSGANTNLQQVNFVQTPAVPSNFSADQMIQLKDVNGVTYYVSAKSSPW
jgi:hypothetical protein